SCRATPASATPTNPASSAGANRRASGSSARDPLGFVKTTHFPRSGARKKPVDHETTYAHTLHVAPSNYGRNDIAILTSAVLNRRRNSRIQRAAHSCCSFLHDVRVDHRRADVVVAQQFLDRANVLAHLQQMRSK